MPRKPAIILDIDGVLLDWVGSFAAWMESLGHRVNPGEADSWEMTSKFPGKSWEEIKGFIRTFNASEHFGDLREVDGARDGVARLRAAFPDHLVAAVSSSCARPQSVARRCRNVEAFDLDEIFIAPLGESKEPWLRRYGPGSVMVEDNAENALAAIGCGHQAILLNYDHNRAIPVEPAIRIDHWREIDRAIARLKLARAA